MSNRTRAFRRHHRQRMINRAMRRLFVSQLEDDHIWGKRYAIWNHNHLAKCSCFMCGNPRHNCWASSKERLTMQERKVYNVLSEEVEDYYVSSCPD